MHRLWGCNEELGADLPCGTGAGGRLQAWIAAFLLMTALDSPPEAGKSSPSSVGENENKWFNKKQRSVSDTWLTAASSSCCYKSRRWPCFRRG